MRVIFASRQHLLSLQFVAQTTLTYTQTHAHRKIWCTREAASVSLLLIMTRPTRLLFVFPILLISRHWLAVAWCWSSSWWSLSWLFSPFSSLYPSSCCILTHRYDYHFRHNFTRRPFREETIQASSLSNSQSVLSLLLIESYLRNSFLSLLLFPSWAKKKKDTASQSQGEWVREKSKREREGENVSTRVHLIHRRCGSTSWILDLGSGKKVRGRKNNERECVMLEARVKWVGGHQCCGTCGTLCSASHWVTLSRALLLLLFFFFFPHKTSGQVLLSLLLQETERQVDLWNGNNDSSSWEIR